MVNEPENELWAHWHERWQQIAALPFPEDNDPDPDLVEVDSDLAGALDCAIASRGALSETEWQSLVETAERMKLVTAHLNEGEADYFSAWIRLAVELIESHYQNAK